VKGLLGFTEQLFWTLLWIFLILIIGFWLLGIMQHWGGPLGSFASWINQHAEPQA